MDGETERTILVHYFDSHLGYFGPFFFGHTMNLR